MSIDNDKQLVSMGMEDENLEKIFSFLDIDSKKSFALVCKKFNQIFGLPKNLDRIKFCFTEEDEKITDNITRQYRHIQEPGNLIPAATLTKLTNLRSYTKNTKKLLSRINANYLVGLLPHFRNLSCLDFRRILYGHRYDTFEHQLQQIFEEQMDIEVVEMKHLKTLMIDLKLFLFLNGRFVNFSCTKLEKLKIVAEILCDDENYDFEPVKSLITSQKQLKVLSLSLSNEIASKMFDTPFIGCRQLRAFKLISDHKYFDAISGYNSTQQNHLAEFLMSQNALEKLTIAIDIGTGVASSKMQYLMNSRLLMPLAKRKFYIFEEHGARRINFDYFTVAELTQSTKPVPNAVTKHLKLYLWRITPEACRNVVHFVSLNYPGLMSLEILGYRNPFYGIDTINQLKHVESLTLPIYEFRTPSAIHIPTLKKLHIIQQHVYGGDDEWNEVYKTNLKPFFEQHKLIEEIVMKIDASAARTVDDKQLDSEFHEIIENALIQLQNLRKFNICVDIRFYKLTKRWSHSSKASKMLTESIKKYANGGFVLQCGPSESSSEIIKLMKTFDGAVVKTWDYGSEWFA